MSATLPCHKSDLYWIVWEDAVGDSTRAHQDVVKAQQLAVNTNVGWILHEDDRRIVLAHGSSSSGEIDHFVIPTVAILERIQLFPTRRKTKKNTEPKKIEADSENSRNQKTPE